MKKRIWIGIDSDVDKNGVAQWYDGTLALYNLKFFELYDFLNELKLLDVFVIIEAGWLNTKSSWHGQGYGEKVASRTGAKVGANHETGKKIVEMCEYLNIPYELKKPETSKVDAKFFKMMTKYEGRTNQETRDAALLVWKRT